LASVLLVDDDRALRKLLRAYLEQESISVLEAATGEEALATIARAAPSPTCCSPRCRRSTPSGSGRASSNQHVANLRRKLAAAAAPGVVETVRGVGYRLVAPAP